MFQAFEPILVEGRAIKLHPLVCSAYNADFDGDQMAVHVPLSVEAQAECRFLLLSPNNLLKPSDGAPVAVPSQDMVLGIYYLTLEKEDEVGEGKVFFDEKEAILAYENKVISLHAKIKVKKRGTWEGEPITQVVDTTVGKVIFNEIFPQDIGFVDRTQKENALKYEIDFLCDKKNIGRIIDRCINKFGTTETAAILDDIKRLGFKFTTRGALTVSISDMEIPPTKYEYLAEAEAITDRIMMEYKRGRFTYEERHKHIIETWRVADSKITKALLDGLGKYNNLFMMAHSGARGSSSQIKQLAGMKGLMASPSGGTIELPIKASFREGLTVLDYFLSAHGARKGLADTALKTADSGYLTRRLVDVSQDIIIREWDCASAEGEQAPYMEVVAFKDGEEIIEPLSDRIRGRWAVENIYHPETNELLVAMDKMIDPDEAMAVEKSGIEKVKIRTALSCRSRIGICTKCYGANMASGRVVRIGETVGIIAAQSVGEPGTQLTMRNFHNGGIASSTDITQGLPRVDELFEARKPKGLAIISEIPGVITVSDEKKKRIVTVTNTEDGEIKEYQIPYGSRIKVYNNDVIEAGDEITEGSVYPQDILRIKGVRGVQDYLIQEVQRVYRLQGVDINDKHIEVIVRQMLKRIKIEEAGDTEFLPGRYVDWLDFEETNKKMIQEGKEPATGEYVLLGITKASLATDSFLSAASFQETTRVLTDAAIKGKIDPLIGLKENVIIGKLIPAGTGMSMYRDIEVEPDESIVKTEESSEEETINIETTEIL